LEARVVDAVKEVLKRAGHVADVGRRAEQVPIPVQDVGRTGRQRRRDHDLDALDLVRVRSCEHSLEHGLHGRRRRVMHEQQTAHEPGA
jgi:hypothetical protein